MNAPTMSLLLIMWVGHDVKPVQIDPAECERALEAIKTAVRLRHEIYALKSEVFAYCIPIDTAANDTVYALLQPPKTNQAAHK